MVNDSGDVRADGPAVVRSGPRGGLTVVVLDPLGEAKHDAVPATWRSVADEVDIVWWRLPATARPTAPGADGPTGLLDGVGTAHLVGAGSAALLTLAIAVAHRDEVASVVLVDPPWPVGDLPHVRRIVDDTDLPIQQVDTADALPLGHPDVVRAVLRAVAPLDGRNSTVR